MEHLSLVWVPSITYQCVAGTSMVGNGDLLYNLPPHVLEVGQNRLLITGDRPPRQQATYRIGSVVPSGLRQIYKLEAASRMKISCARRYGAASKAARL